VRFFYIYKTLAHPGYKGYVAPFSLAERLQHIARAKARLGSQIPWICDTFENDLKHDLGNAPNSEFVIDPEGVLVARRAWSDPAALRQDLTELVGAVEPVADRDKIRVGTLPHGHTAPTGVVPPLALPARMIPLVVEPVEQAEAVPFYAKLRAEASAELMERGEGDLYLGFYLDPLYAVHWNNEMEPLRFELDSPSGISVVPQQAKAGGVSVPTDADPREFLVRVQWTEVDAVLKVTVHYFACDDAETFCIPVTQQYRVALRRDRDGGRRRSSRQGPPVRSLESQQLAINAILLKTLDRDSDGELSEQELAGASRALEQLDKNRDGILNSDELQQSPPVPLSDRYLRYANRLLRKYDLNQDQELTPEEWKQMSESPQSADANGDNRLTAQELLQWLKTR